jgi:hypothetical protein
MKLQAHMPTVSVGARDLRAAKIALFSLFVAAALVLTLQSGIPLNNPLPEPLRKSSVAPTQISVAHRVSLDLYWGSDPVDQWRRFSVAHRYRPMSLRRNHSQLASTSGLRSRSSAKRRYATCWQTRDQSASFDRTMIECC